MSLPSRNKKKRRPLSEIVPNPAPRGRKMSEPGKNSGLKRRAEDFDGRSRGGPINSATKRRESKRVSFGGDFVKYFDKDDKISDNDFGPAQLFPDTGLRINSPALRNPIPSSGVDSFDDVAEDTLHLPGSPPSVPRQASPHPAKRLSLNPAAMNPSSLDPAQLRTSAVFNFIDDESPDLESDELGNETMHMRRDSTDYGAASDFTNASSSQSDISIQIPSYKADGDFLLPEEEDSIPGGFSNQPSPMLNVPSPAIHPNNNADIQPVHAAPGGNPSQHVPSQSFLQKKIGRQSLPAKGLAEKRVQRQSLPENRKLFDMDDEEETIHHKDNPVLLKKQPLSILKKHNYPQPLSLDNRVSEATGTIQTPSNRQREELDRRAQSTPQSVLRSRIREIALDGSASKSNASATLNEHTSPAKEPNFSIDSFLDQLQVHFHRGFAVPRPSVGAGPDDDASRIDLNSMAGKIVSKEMNEAVLAELKSAYATLSARVASMKDEEAASDAAIGNAPPALFRDVGDFANKSTLDISVIQTGAKRLRRKVFMEESLAWVRARAKREQKITDLLTKANQKLYEEEVAMKKNEATLLAIADDLASSLEKANLNGNPVEASDVVTPEDNARLLNLWEARQGKLRTRDAVKNRTKDAEAKLDALEKQYSEIDEKLAEARLKLSAGSESILEAAVEQKKREADLLAAVVGIQISKITSNNVDARVAGFADVRFTLSGRSVTSVDVYSLFDRGSRMNPNIVAYINAAISKCTESCFKNTTRMKQIPMVLHLTSTYLHKVKKSFLDALYYLDEHGQDSEFIKAAEANEDSADLVVCPSYFSYAKRVLFDVTLTLRFFPPQFDGKTLERKTSFSSLNVGPITKIVGEPPAVQDIKDIINLRSEIEGKPQLTKYIGIRQNMEAIRELL